MRLLMRIWKSRKFEEHAMAIRVMHAYLWLCPWSKVIFLWLQNFLYFLKIQNFLAWELMIDGKVMWYAHQVCFKHKAPFPDLFLVCGQRTPTTGYCLSVTLIGECFRTPRMGRGFSIKELSSSFACLNWIVMYDRWAVPIGRICLKTKS